MPKTLKAQLNMAVQVPGSNFFTSEIWLFIPENARVSEEYSEMWPTGNDKLIASVISPVLTYVLTLTWLIIY